MSRFLDEAGEDGAGGLYTDGENLMQASSLDATLYASGGPGGGRVARRRGRGVSSTGGTSGATASESQTQDGVDWRQQVLVQQQQGIESTRERATRIRDLTEGFYRAVTAIPALTHQLDALQTEAAAICMGSVVSDGEPRSAVGASPRVLVSVADLLALADFSFYAHPLIANPCAALPALEAAVAEEWRSRGALGPPPRVGVSGWLGDDHVTPRGLNSSKLNRLVCVEGVVNRCSAVSPKLSKAVYVTEDAPLAGPSSGERAEPHSAEASERQVHIRSFFDVTDLDKDVRDAQPPPERDPEGRRVNRQEVAYCSFKNHQKFFVQEAPEASPTGQLPRWVEVIAEEDLVDSVKCGDRIRVYGVYRPRAGPANSQCTGLVRPVLIANNIQVLSAAQRASALCSSPDLLETIRAFAQRPDMLQVLTRSFAPAVCGLWRVKRGLLLLLAGGVERLSPTGHRIRGDIHALLVGDPSAGKSQLLRFCLSLLPNAISTTGRGCSGVGLTAAVVTDALSGERRVEGGAAVMGDGGVICVDEFDKMSPGDRVSMHEVMEQQTVTVAKAGIHTTLNARCSVIAAANPLYGCWSDDMAFNAQLAFEDSLLTRFDLIFLVRDAATTEADERLAEAVLRNVTEKAQPIPAVCTERRSTGDCHVQPTGDMEQKSSLQTSLAERSREDGAAENIKVFYQRNEMLYHDEQGRDHECVTHDFLKKYLAYVRARGYEETCAEEGSKNKNSTISGSGPLLSDEAAAAIVSFYSEIRQRASSEKAGGTSANSSGAPCAALMQAVTVRTLEACVRLATAHAKLKLKKWVTQEDVAVAQELLLYTLFGEAFEEGGEEESSESSEDDDDEEEMSEREDESEIEVPRRTTAADRAARREALSKKRRGEGKEAETPEEVISAQMEGLGLQGKKRRTRKQTDEASKFVNQGALREEVLHSLILQSLKLIDDGSGVGEAPLLEAVNERARSKGLREATSEELQRALTEINKQDSAPILFHDGLVYMC